MEMKIHLDSDIFDIVKNDSKNVEVRLNDEKRKKLKVGDKLIFLKRPNDDEVIETEILKLSYYDSFFDVLNDYDMKSLYLENYTPEMWLKELNRFYTPEQEKEYGVVAILFKK